MRTVSGTYGSGKTPCDVYIYENRDGSYWYAVDGSVNVNRTWEEYIEDGVDVEELDDFDMFTWPKGIHSEEELEEAVNG